MRLIHVSQAPPECGHHWHVYAAGWECCWCPAKVGRQAVPPRSYTSLCLAADEPADELLTWLQSFPPADPRIVRARRRVRA